jgi:hypothetical protein
MSHQDNYPDKLHGPTRDHHIQIKENKMNVYTENGYKSREDYLKSLAEDYGLTFKEVKVFSDTLGPTEDFDALVSTIQDYSDHKPDLYEPTAKDLKDAELEAARLDAEIELFGDEPARTLDMATGEILEGEFAAKYITTKLKEVGFTADQILLVLDKRGLRATAPLLNESYLANCQARSREFSTFSQPDAWDN